MSWSSDNNGSSLTPCMCAKLGPSEYHTYAGRDFHHNFITRLTPLVPLKEVPLKEVPLGSLDVIAEIDEIEEPLRTETGSLTQKGIFEMLEKIETVGRPTDITFANTAVQFQTDGDFVATFVNGTSTVVCQKWLSFYLTPKNLRGVTFKCACREPHRHNQGEHRTIYDTLPCSNGSSCWKKSCSWAHFGSLPITTTKQPALLASLTFDLVSRK